MRLSKHHGLGNDFLVALAGENAALDAVGADLARHLCDRRRGIGADGLILGLPAADADAQMVLLNADGGRAEMSGNGIRCLGQALARERGIDRGRLLVRTDAGPRELRLEPTDDPATLLVSVGMGPVGEGPHVPTPVAEILNDRFRTVDVGNPHIVVLVDDPERVDLPTEGAWLERQFPDGVNVEFVTTAGDDRLALRVWERGAGITEACGTGACAAAWAARQWDLVGPRVTVAMPGGSATVVLDGDGATLIGPATHVADLEVADRVTATTGGGRA